MSSVFLLTVTLFGCGGRSDTTSSVREVYDASAEPRDAAAAGADGGAVVPEANTNDESEAEQSGPSAPNAGTGGIPSGTPDAERDDEDPSGPDGTTDPVGGADDVADGVDDSTDRGAGSDPTTGVDVPAPVLVNAGPCGVAPSSPLRLTNSQYDHTIRDLLGLTQLDAADGASPSSLLPASNVDVISASDWEAYTSVAQAIAEQVVGDERLLANFLPCPLTDGDACLAQAITGFGRRAFRRPLSMEEIGSFESVSSASAGSTPSEAAQALLTAFLVAPAFVQRVESSGERDEDGYYQLSSHEVAARLSYVLWDTMPDAELSAQADADALRSDEQIIAQVARMMQSPNFVDGLNAFHRSYMEMGRGSRWERGSSEASFFLYSDAALPGLQAETERFFSDVILSGGVFADFFMSDVAFVNNLTAPLYGLSATDYGDELTRVSLPDRPGFLTRAGFLRAFSNPDSTAPILRGGFITMDVLGVDVGNDPDLPVQPPTPDLAGLQTNRQRVEALTAFPECAGCHEPFLNPPGYVLEAYDAVGAFRSVEVDTGATIDTAAEVYIDGMQVPVAGPAEMMAALAESSDARRRYARDWINSITGRRSDSFTDDCAVEELADKLNESDYTITRMLADLALLPQFRMRAEFTR